MFLQETEVEKLRCKSNQLRQFKQKKPSFCLSPLPSQPNHVNGHPSSHQPVLCWGREQAKGMRGLHLAVPHIRATGFLTERNLMKHLYVLHSGLHHCVSPALNLRHPHPQQLSPLLSKEKEDAWLTSAVAVL